MTFRAPWSPLLKWTSGLVTLMMVGMTAFFYLLLQERPEHLWAGPIPMVVLLGALAFTIRGYELDRQGLHVRRLIWTTHVPLDSLESVQVDPQAMKRSLRLFGNGGLFSFSGIFRNRKLGNYRALATDPKRSVVLDLGQRKVVVTPDRPSRMAQKLKEMWPAIEVETGDGHD